MLQSFVILKAPASFWMLVSEIIATLRPHCKVETWAGSHTHTQESTVTSTETSWPSLPVNKHFLFLQRRYSQYIYVLISCVTSLFRNVLVVLDIIHYYTDKQTCRNMALCVTLLWIYLHILSILLSRKHHSCLASVQSRELSVYIPQLPELEMGI